MGRSFRRSKYSGGSELNMFLDNEIFYYIRNNIQNIRDDIVLMVSGEPVPIAI